MPRRAHIKKEEEEPPWTVYTPPWSSNNNKEVKREPQDDKITFVQPEDQAPWKKAPPHREGFTTLVHPSKGTMVVALPTSPSKKQKEDVQPPSRQKGKRKAVEEESPVLLCARNYAAIEAGREAFGLIDQGVMTAGVRNLLVHVRRNPRPWAIMNGIRVGSTIMALRERKGGVASPLRVRFTTPSRYYTPSAKVTSMLIGVNEADWQSLMHESRRI